MQVKRLSARLCFRVPQTRRPGCLNKNQARVCSQYNVAIRLAYAVWNDRGAPLGVVTYILRSGRPAVRNWRRAATAVERETGLDVHSHQEYPQQLEGLSKKFVTKIVTVIGEQYASNQQH